MITVAMIRELDRLFQIARTTDQAAAWNDYFQAKARVDRIANRIAS
jgi:hypothetical protein